MYAILMPYILIYYYFNHFFIYFPVFFKKFKENSLKILISKNYTKIN